MTTVVVTAARRLIVGEPAAVAADHPQLIDRAFDLFGGGNPRIRRGQPWVSGPLQP
ncbi:hypothetical protein ACWGQ5_49760 [Streptomyces sp. NPDC055722]